MPVVRGGAAGGLEVDLGMDHAPLVDDKQDAPPVPQSADPRGRTVVGAWCNTCDREWSHLLYLNRTWGEDWVQCLWCGEERQATG